MRKAIKMALAMIAAMAAIGITSAAILVYLNKDKCPNENENDWFVYVDGKEMDLYSNSSVYDDIKELDSNKRGDMRITGVGFDPYSLIEKEGLVKCFLGDNYSTNDVGFETNYRLNKSGKMFAIRKDGFICFSDSSEYGELKYSELLTNDELLNKANGIMKTFKVNRSELKLNRISNSIDEVDSVYGSGTEQTFWVQLLIFDQYIEGIRIAGCKGTIKIAFGKEGRLIHYEDNTIKYKNVEESKYNEMKSINQTLREVADSKESIREGSVKILECELVFYAESWIIREGNSIYSHYRIKLSPANEEIGEYKTLYCRT